MSINGEAFKEWNTEEFREEIMQLSEGFLDFCLLWGLTFGNIDDNDNDKDVIEKAIRFTRKEFPKRYPELNFEKVYGTLFNVATSYDNDVFVVLPEINTIYNYYSQGGSKHDLITPIITTLANDCSLQAYSWRHRN